MQKNIKKSFKKRKKVIKNNKNHVIFQFLCFFVGLFLGFLIYFLNNILFNNFCLIVNTCLAISFCLFLVYSILCKIKIPHKNKKMIQQKS